MIRCTHLRPRHPSAVEHQQAQRAERRARQSPTAKPWTTRRPRVLGLLNSRHVEVQPRAAQV